MSDETLVTRPWYVRYSIAVWKFFVGVMLCQFMLGAVVVVGWTTRLMQRQILWSWWKKSPMREQGGTFEASVRDLPSRCAPRALPNWCLAEPNREAEEVTGNRIRQILGRAFGSLKLNFRQGLAGVLSIFVFTLPATSLWLYSWVLGWNISFFKLYEQSALGPLLGISGVLLFVFAMLYVPLAHARQAMTGNWRTFFDLRSNWRLAWRHPMVMLPVAILFVVASAPIMALRVAPYFIGSGEGFATMTVEELRLWLENYYLGAGLLLLPAYVAVWVAVAKAYARAAIQEYVASPESCPLGDAERHTLSNLQYKAEANSMATHPLIRGTSWTFGRIAGWAAFGLTCFAWFGVAAQVFVAQFLNYYPGAVWLNHPLVLLPWIKYIPPGLIP